MSPKAEIIVVCILSLVLGSIQSQTSSEIDPILNERKSCGLNKHNLQMTEPEPIPSGSEGCGYRNPNGVDFSITGNKAGESQFGEFPWMVAILRIYKANSETYKAYWLEGTVIAPNVVLTNAFYLQDMEPQNLIARAGEWDMRTINEILPHQDARVKEIICHEKFHNLERNDVALLILETPFNWTGNVRPICLPEPNTQFDYSRCYATSWGYHNYNDVDQYHVILKKKELPTVPHGTCEAQLRRSRGKSYNMDPSFMCAANGTDTRTFNSGSPLACPDPRNPERYYQAGILSWFVRGGEGRFPQVFASVPYLRNWINEKLSARGIDFSHFTM